MSTRPDILSVITAHAPRIEATGRIHGCACNWSTHLHGRTHRAHLAAALNLALDDWLADEWTREAVSAECWGCGHDHPTPAVERILADRLAAVQDYARRCDDAANHHAARAESAEAENARLRAVAENRIQHRFMGACPDELEGYDSRDPECPACAALDSPTSHTQQEHIDTDPLCSRHVAPTTTADQVRFDEGRGRTCPVCESEYDDAQISRGMRDDAEVSSHAQLEAEVGARVLREAAAALNTEDAATDVALLGVDYVIQRLLDRADALAADTTNPAPTDQETP